MVWLRCTNVIECRPIRRQSIIGANAVFLVYHRFSENFVRLTKLTVSSYTIELTTRK